MHFQPLSLHSCPLAQPMPKLMRVLRGTSCNYNLLCALITYIHQTAFSWVYDPRKRLSLKIVANRLYLDRLSANLQNNRANYSELKSRRFKGSPLCRLGCGLWNCETLKEPPRGFTGLLPLIKDLAFSHAQEFLDHRSFWASFCWGLLYASLLLRIWPSTQPWSNHHGNVSRTRRWKRLMGSG